MQYQQSEYVAGFGLRVGVEHGPLRVQARILQPPTLRYGEKSKVATIVSNPACIVISVISHLSFLRPLVTEPGICELVSISLDCPILTRINLTLGETKNLLSRQPPLTRGCWSPTKQSVDSHLQMPRKSLTILLWPVKKSVRCHYPGKDDAFLLMLTILGINLAPTTHIDYHNAQGNIEGQLNNFGSNVLKDRKKPPQLILAILPEGGNDTYVAVKQ